MYKNIHLLIAVKNGRVCGKNTAVGEGEEKTAGDRKGKDMRIMKDNNESILCM